MVDKIIKDLNQEVANKLAKLRPAENSLYSGQVSPFEDILNDRRQKLIFDKMEQTLLHDNVQDKMRVMAADDIHIDIKDEEFGAQGTFDGKKALVDMFATINDDSLKMDSIIEVLSSEDVKLSRRQLLAYQASIGTLTINVDLVSKLAQSVSQNLMTFFQMNLG